MKAMLRVSWVLLLIASVSITACSQASTPAATVSAHPETVAAPVPKGAVAESRPVRLLADAIGEHKLVLLGEIHGTQETPALLADLVEQETNTGNPVVLALEIPTNDQSIVDHFMGSSCNPSDTAALLAGKHWQPMHDGRDSQAMAALIGRMCQLREDGAEIFVNLFDEGGGGDRNKVMADHLRRLVQRSPRPTVLVLTGNIHAMTSALPWKMFDNGKQIEPPMAMGRYLADLQPLSINIDAAGGEAWNCMDRECKPHAMLKRGTPPVATLEFQDPSESAWNATLTLPGFTASPPAVDDGAE